MTGKNLMFEYKTIRSDRKTMSLIVREGKVLVRAPYCATERAIADFVESHADWVMNKLAEQKAREEKAAETPRLSPAELRKLHAQAAAVIPIRAAHYAPLIGVTYGSISYRVYKSKWGSCSPDGRLQFNILLMLAPPEVIDSVVVHELCHRKVMNHSASFYREVLRVCPDYYRLHQWLKDHQSEIMARAGLT